MQYRALVSIGLAGAVCAVAACSGGSLRGMPRLQGEPSDDRPAWLRDLPQPLERHPAPEGWGGDHLAAVINGAASRAAQVPDPRPPAALT